MERKEVLEILAYLKVNYENSFKGLTKADLETKVKQWERHFKEFSYQEVLNAVDAIISTDTSDFAPKIGKVKEMIYKLHAPNQMNEMEAWTILKKAIGRSGYHAREEFGKLPPNIQRLVGSPRQLFDWSQTDTDDLNTVVSSNFMRNYRNVTQREKEQHSLPLEIKQAIGITVKKMDMIE